MTYLDRKNAATFKRCQARYDAMEHPDYYRDDPPPCWICGDDSDQVDDEELPICEECHKKWYVCPICGEKFEYRAKKENDACDDCKAESWGE